MSARIAVGAATGLVVGVLATWLLGVLTDSLVLPAVAVLLVAALVWRVRRHVAVAMACGAAAVTGFFGWLFASLGGGLSSL